MHLGDIMALKNITIDTSKVSLNDCSGMMTWVPTSATTTTKTWASSATIDVSSTYIDSKIEEAVKKYKNKVDKHVDELEEDIEYLNGERQKMALEIDTLKKRVDGDAILIRELFDKVQDLSNIIIALEDNINGKILYQTSYTN